ncbi:hypothetical protein HAX54_040087, partial [Datura stramonium]|nr:hypothetical protein [Datura stramonium]
QSPKAGFGDQGKVECSSRWPAHSSSLALSGTKEKPLHQTQTRVDRGNGNQSALVLNIESIDWKIRRENQPKD